MLSLTEVTLRRGPRLLFADATFQAHAGQRIGLVGANGSGKSSLFAALLGELETDRGEIRLPPGARVAHVAQESPRGSHSALDFVMDGDAELRALQRAIGEAQTRGPTAATHDLFERMEAIDGYAAEARAARLLDGLGFGEADLARPVGTFSGGWRMRLNLAQALMCRSDILLLDEPTNHLDLPAILWLESWLSRYPGILLLVSHDRDFLDALCTRIAHIEHEHVRLYTGNYSQFEDLRAEQLAQQEALYRKQQKEIRHIQSYVDRFRYKASKARQAQSRLKMLERMTRIAPAHVDSPYHFEFLEPPRQPQHLAQLESVTAGYERPVLEGVNLLISAGDRIGLLGVNGAGKSTLVKALADGSTLLAGERVVSRDTRFGYFAQHQLDQLDPRHSPLDHIRLLEPGTHESELRRFLGRFGFGDERIHAPVAPFSGGEKARLVLALMIRQQPNLLLLDEPTNHLDLEMRQALCRALVDFPGAIVLISHDRHLLRSVCDDLLVVHDGVVERFDRGLDDYPSWLAERQARATRGDSLPAADVPAARTDSGDADAGAVNRKRQRQLEAQRRQALKPLSDRVRRIEQGLVECRAALDRLESQLADPELYADPARKDEIGGLTRRQAELRTDLSNLEADWLDASEALERAALESQI
ncbi:MAG: ATP-binding cassette domain-containing protein [Xanthomonadales bacterium]|nr:ATP-binding cassette domain-containing protein [Xanthomonadales bacterium]